jgi:hypothetical protein
MKMSKKMVNANRKTKSRKRRKFTRRRNVQKMRMPRKRRPRNFIDDFFLCSAVVLQVKKEMMKITKWNNPQLRRAQLVLKIIFEAPRL